MTARLFLFFSFRYGFIMLQIFLKVRRVRSVTQDSSEALFGLKELIERNENSRGIGLKLVFSWGLVEEKLS